MENIMFADAEEIRARCRSTPTIAERRESESAIAISEMRISQNGPITADVAVQVDSSELIFQFPDILPGTSVSHYDLLQTANRSPPQSRSMPQSPYSSRGHSTRRPMGSVHRIVTWGKENGEVTRHNDQRILSGVRGQKMMGSPQLQPARNNDKHINCVERPRKDNVSITCLFRCQLRVIRIVVIIFLLREEVS